MDTLVKKAQQMNGPQTGSSGSRHFVHTVTPPHSPHVTQADFPKGVS